MLRTGAALLSLLLANRLAGASYVDLPDTVLPDTPSPNTAIAKPECNPNITVSIRYSKGSRRLYVESSDDVSRGGCITPTEIWTSMGGSSPLYPVNATSGSTSNTATGTWLLTQSLWVKDGITLQVGDSLLHDGFRVTRCRAKRLRGTII